MHRLQISNLLLNKNPPDIYAENHWNTLPINIMPAAQKFKIAMYVQKYTGR